MYIIYPWYEVLPALCRGWMGGSDMREDGKIKEIQAGGSMTATQWHLNSQYEAAEAEAV